MDETAYTALAGIYEAVGLEVDSEYLRRRLFDRIQSEGWLGRRILELGSGVGEAALWFASNGFRVTAVDRAPAMMAIARQKAAKAGVTVDWQEADARELAPGDGYDLVLAMNTLNEVRRTSELEAVFRMANCALSMDKILMFDLVTIQGLAVQWGDGDYVLHDAPDSLSLVVRSRFSYETFMNTRDYMIYSRQAGGWERADEAHALRGFALQSVGTLLQRTGFRVQSLLNPAFEPFDPYEDRSGRAIFIAFKERDLG